MQGGVTGCRASNRVLELQGAGQVTGCTVGLQGAEPAKGYVSYRVQGKLQGTGQVTECRASYRVHGGVTGCRASKGVRELQDAGQVTGCRASNRVRELQGAGQVTGCRVGLQGAEPAKGCVSYRAQGKLQGAGWGYRVQSQQRGM